MDLRRTFALTLPWLFLLTPSSRGDDGQASSQPSKWEEGLLSLDPVPALRKSLRDKDADERLHAVEALARLDLRAQGVVPALMDALKDGEAEIRQHAAFGLSRIGPEAGEYVPALVDAMKSKDGVVRVH